MDYEKAFDSVQTQAILTSLQEQGIEDVYIEILKGIYTDSSVTVHLHKESEKIRIKRGVRQGDTISPKLFTATLESKTEVKLGEQGRKDRRRMSLQSPLC